MSNSSTVVVGGERRVVSWQGQPWTYGGQKTAEPLLKARTAIEEALSAYIEEGVNGERVARAEAPVRGGTSAHNEELEWPRAALRVIE